MSTVTLVTGNKNKLSEWQKVLPSDIKLESKDIDLPEIQSLDLYEIVKDKAEKAYKAVGGPVIVEDVSAALDDLGGLPGPFYKFFRKELGDQILVKLSSISSTKVTISCLAAYYDGKKMLFGEGIIHGEVVEPRGSNGFGFDPVILPEGETLTMAEMTPEAKNKISHRARAIALLVAQL